MSMDPGLPGDLTLRPAEREDLAAVVDLLVACDRAEIGRPDTDANDVEAMWVRAGFDLGLDARVVEARERPALAGYAVVFDGRAEAAVHPGELGRGIGTALRRFIESRAREQTAAGMPATVWQPPRRDNEAARRLLVAAGWVPAHSYAQLEADVTGDPLEEPVWPDCVSVRTLLDVETDAPRLHRLQNEAWAVYETYEPPDYERWSDLLREPDFDASLWFLAEAGDELAGMCLCREGGDEAWVTSLGVHPGWQRRGVGEALLRHAMAVLKARGARRIGLSVSSRQMPEARRLYERAGMREIAGWQRFEKRVIEE